MKRAKSTEQSKLNSSSMKTVPTLSRKGQKNYPNGFPGKGSLKNGQ